ncbi:lipid IV(A) 3-deoxy-D-manno-octulosonic acid transferase [Motilimonas pumila]|uniref:3-deoxy-D-manno-octulosonic acid transferase n=1 Tax=Motilimonas pumila TaxID=2303987 RepID=A0A418YHJ8_9GAMM|nr:lipid IV(A) 3-deoxy-D-manno-octulosonic acid transferase [Motilimonas pumila]RJG49576.1 3-deoxy-D-manno-octulosonic acid transferase [Motilimonas pumila]
MIYRLVYTLIMLLVCPFLLFGLYKRKPGKPAFGSRWKEHFGFTPALLQNDKPVIWVHAVSVGESIAVTPVLKSLQQSYPQYQIVVTTTTSTGAEQIAKLTGVTHRYMPIDFSWCVRRFLNVIKPQVMIIMETELWPNTLASVAAKAIPIILLNGRLSARSARRYGKFKGAFAQLGGKLSHLLTVHQDDASRFIALGVPANKVTVTGSIKYDIQLPKETLRQGAELRQQLGHQRPVFIAASTHQGEDEQVLSAFKAVQKSIKEALLILVPRHPERFQTVFELCQSQGFNVQKRTEPQTITSDLEVYLGDTMGEMLTLMAAADVTVMGGSLLGDKVGGHNLLEPAALAKPSIIGPSYFNFSDITEQLQQAGATHVCANSQQLAQQLIALLKDKDQQQVMGKHALNVVNRNKGAVDKSITLIGNYLTPS